MDRMIPPPHASEFLHARTQAVSDILMVILALTPLAQAFWFVRAWRVIDAVAWPGPRAVLQGLWVAAALVVVAAALDMLRVRVLPRRTFGPWGWAVARLWLIASCLGCLAMTA